MNWTLKLNVFLCDTHKFLGDTLPADTLVCGVWLKCSVPGCTQVGEHMRNVRLILEHKEEGAQKGCYNPVPVTLSLY